jgi:hypothetical protein
MLELFDGPRSISADDASISEGHRMVDGRIGRFVTVDIDRSRALVMLSVSDAVAVEAAIDPFLALSLGESLINAALAVYFRPGGPLVGKARDATHESAAVDQGRRAARRRRAAT